MSERFTVTLLGVVALVLAGVCIGAALMALAMGFFGFAIADLWMAAMLSYVARRQIDTPDTTIAFDDGAPIGPASASAGSASEGLRTLQRLGDDGLYGDIVPWTPRRRRS